MIVFPKTTDKLETSSLKLQYQAFLEKDDLRNGKNKSIKQFIGGITN